MEYIVRLIRAACVLHNLTVEDDFHVGIADEINGEDDHIENVEPNLIFDEDEEEIQANRNAVRIRDAVVNSLA